MTVQEQRTDSPASPDKDPQINDHSREIANKFIARTQNELVPGPDLFAPLAEAWTTVLKAGMIKERKFGLLKKFSTPKNLQLSRAPPVNPKVKSALLSSKARIIIKRDSYQICPDLTGYRYLCPGRSFFRPSKKGN